MKRLIVKGDPGLRKGGIIDYDGEEMICFSVTRNGDYHGPERVQLWCIIGRPDEQTDFENRTFIPHFLATESVEGEDLDIIKAAGDLAV